jgi:signal transduction histidine kinase/CheY-like chemotaxis protein
MKLDVGLSKPELAFLTGGGEMGARLRAFDWGTTRLGPPANWPPALRSALAICLGSTVPTAIYWGPDLLLLYNDAWAPIPAERHPGALGQPAAEVWTDIWDVVAPQFVQVQNTGQGFSAYDQRLDMQRDGVPRETYWNYSFSPIPDETGAVAGILNQGYETTARVLGERRAEFLLALSDRLRVVDEPQMSIMTAVRALGEHLDVSRVGFATVFAAGEMVRLDSVYEKDVPALAGDFPIEVFGPENIRNLRAGRTTVYPDVSGVPDMAGDVLAPFETRALMGVPLIREGALRAMLYVNHHEVRDWRPYEVSLAQDVASRIWDAVERARAEATLREETAALETLNTVGAELAGELDLQRLIERFMNSAARLTGADYAAYFERDQSAAHEDVWRLFTMVGAPMAMFERLGLPRATNLFKPTFLAEGVVRSDDVTADPRYGSMGGMPKGHFPVRSYLAVSVVSRSGTRLGALLFGHRQPGMFGPRQERMATGLAGQASIAIDNAQLFKASQIEIAERKRAEAALRELNDTLEERIAARTQELMETEEQLRQSQKMEAVGQLTGGLAHDFNNLLTGITGSLELLQTRVRQGRTGDLERYINAAQGASKRAAALTHRLLAFSRRQTLDPKPTDVNRLVADMEEMIRRTVGPAITVETVMTASVWSTLVDPNQLENALLNLSINARDAMPNGGRITVETANRWLDDRAARMRDLPPGQYVSLCVSDNGTGMPPDIARRAFDPFFTTKPIGQGTGLGLSMIYGFARQSGGQVRIYSEPGQGTMVCLYIPRYLGDAAPDDHAQDELSNAPRAEQGETVLVVDDEPTVRMLVTEVLEELGYQALEAEDGASGLKILESRQRIDLLVTDVGLPGGMNGRQMADAARAVRPGLKVLFITGYAENAVLSHGHLDQGMHVLTKPFAMDALAARIKDLITK